LKLNLPSWGRLWSHRDFMRLWASETIGAFGRQVTGLALPTVAILLLGAGPFEMGVLNGLGVLAFPLLGLFVGVWADRWRRRPIMVAANLGRMVALGSIPFAYVLGLLHLYQLYIVSAIVGVFTVFFDVAYQSYLPSLIDRADLVEGNSKLETSQSAAQVAGPAIAGFLIQLVDAAKAIAADAAAFLASAIFIFSIKKAEPNPQASAQDPNFLAELKEGAAIVFGNAILRRIAGCTATSNLGTGIVFTVFLIYAYEQLQLTPSVIGVIFGIGSVGVLLGAMVAAKVARELGLGRTIAISILISSVGLLIVPLASFWPAVMVLTVSQMVAGFGIPVYNINQISLRQAITPDRLQGRMNATMRTIVWGTIPLGSFLGGILGSQVGVVPTIVAGAVISSLSAVWVVFGPVMSLREAPTPVE